jgi:hypothetical protein
MQIIETLETGLKNALNFFSCKFCALFFQQNQQSFSNDDLIVGLFRRGFTAYEGKGQLRCDMHVSIQLNRLHVT